MTDHFSGRDNAPLKPIAKFSGPVGTEAIDTKNIRLTHQRLARIYPRQQ